jgi:hypothetical protein
MPMQLRASMARVGAVGVVIAALGAASCDESLREVTGPSPDLVPTLASIQKEIFETTDLAGRNSCVSCHTNVGRFPPMGLNLAGDSYAALVNVPSRERPALMLVEPGDPENSYLIHKIEGRSGIVGTKMPFNGPPFLTPGQILVVKRWIELGAPR